MNRNSPSMVVGPFTKKYPRYLLKETQTEEDGYPQYRRGSLADGGFTIKVIFVDLDNRWVVPNIPILPRTFLANIDVEYCNSVKSIKYVCMCINKESDQATFTVEDLNEVMKRSMKPDDISVVLRQLGAISASQFTKGFIL
ncbi:hypothetical protein AVEN_162188-1 [Araneus ventricosus]|uniref:Uncharacterized protein n=1 Tax=Araneus ventricosus TaxID=182803 RepID=A0A4Y2R850_ARAVE|nr:hypothetical protein AVEN_140473-1 [Araneus ventricosus]GBN71893.1 hypothetical protein AVEN_162188-1 [Araneus ventricosus]